KLRDSTQRAANGIGREHLASAKLCNAMKTRAKPLSSIRNPLLYPAELRAQKLCNMSPLSLEKSRMNAEWLKVRKLQGRFGLKIDQSLRIISTGSQLVRPTAAWRVLRCI